MFKPLFCLGSKGSPQEIGESVPMGRTGKVISMGSASKRENKLLAVSALAHRYIGRQQRAFGLKLIQSRILSRASINIWWTVALVAKICTWESITLGGKDIHEGQSYYVDGRLLTVMKEALLIRSLSL